MRTSHQSGGTREASTARIEDVRVRQPSIGGLLHVIEGAREGMGGEVRGQRRRRHPRSGMSRGGLGLGARSGEDVIEAQWVA